MYMWKIVSRLGNDTLFRTAKSQYPTLKFKKRKNSLRCRTRENSWDDMLTAFPGTFFPLYILYYNWQPAILVASLNTQTWTQIKRLVEFIAWSSLLRMPSIKIILIFCHIQKRMVHPVYRFVREREMFASQRIAGVCLCMYIYIYAK